MTTFANILDHCLALGRDLSDVVFIGGVAVYLHAAERAGRVPLEASHDADFMISLADYGVLREMEEVTSTPRLGKHQMFSAGVEFDVYVERLNRLVVPYDEVRAHAVELEGVKAACLEHLLVLKLEALTQRGHTTKGEKDRRDVAKIGLLATRSFDPGLVGRHLTRDHEAVLREVARSTVFLDMCGGNAHGAKKMRSSFASFASRLG